MKSFIAIALFVSICTAQMEQVPQQPAAEDVCHSNVVIACNPTTFSQFADRNICDARYGGIAHVESEVQAYINSQLSKSYEYLLLATHFNSYQKNRPGFQKLFQGLSDRSFDDTVDLIKQITRRGGKVNFNTIHESPAAVPRRENNLEVDELHSLAMALDNEKLLSKGAMHLHTRSLHATEKDPEMAHYMEEKFLGKQAKSVRQLSGYTSDLSKLMKLDDPSLAVYLFDEFLQKQ